MTIPNGSLMFLLLVLVLGVLGLFVTTFFLIGLAVVLLAGLSLLSVRRLQSSRRVESEQQGYVVAKGSVTKLLKAFGARNSDDS